MIIPDEVICKTCEKVFCCSECREKHEHKVHAILVQRFEPILHLFCPICEKKPLILHELMHTELLNHIAEKHLPLNCRKCSRLYTKIEHFLEFSKCIQSNVSCNLEVAIVSGSPIAEESTQQPLKSCSSSVSTQTSPFRVPDINDSHLTPISMINLRWKAKSKITEEFISDSVSSIKNISSINNSSIRKSIGLGGPLIKGKLVRSTSTPLQAELVAKPKEQAFNVSGGHMSSIHNSVSESESSPSSAPQMRPIESTYLSRYQKPRGLNKISAAVTPLRQVMSKSIQKAIAEHGIAAENRAFGYNRKKIFQSIDSSSEILEKSEENIPLDLRLSPAVRRTQSEIIDCQSQMEFLQTIGKAPPGVQILLSSTKKTERTESIVITSSNSAESVTENAKLKDNKSGSSIYQTCRSVEIITSTSTELSQVNIKNKEVIYEQNVPPITPRIPTSGVLTNKKVIKFETPVVAKEKIKSEKQSPDELFFTPSSTPIRTSRIPRQFPYENNSRSSNQSRKFYSMDGQENDKIESSSDYTDVAFDDEVFVQDKKPERSRSRLWNLVASVIRLPSLAADVDPDDAKRKDETELYDNSTSIIRRCASFAGSLVRQKAIDEDDIGKAVKRKRTYTNDFNFSKGNHTDIDLTCSDSKRFRIHGRMPIQRMRCNY